MYCILLTLYKVSRDSKWHYIWNTILIPSARWINQSSILERRSTFAMATTKYMHASVFNLTIVDHQTKFQRPLTKKRPGKSSWTDRSIYQPAEQAVELRGPQLKNSGCVITEPDHADWSMQLPVIPMFCLAVWFLSGDKAAGTARTTGRPKGHQAKQPELRRQILCRFRACLVIVCVCLLAFIHVCGPGPCVVMSFWIHNRRLLGYLFLHWQSGSHVWLLQPPSLAQGHSIR